MSQFRTSTRTLFPAVVIPELAVTHRWEALLRTHRATTLRFALVAEGNSRITVIDVPSYLNAVDETTPPGTSTRGMNAARDHRSFMTASDDQWAATQIEVTHGTRPRGFRESCRQPGTGPEQRGTSRRLVHMLAALEPELAITGHGRPVKDPGLCGSFHALAAYFDEVAVPRHAT